MTDSGIAATGLLDIGGFWQGVLLAFETFGPVITLLVLSLAVWEFLAARKTRKTLAQVADATQTKGAGSFPGYMEKVIELIESAESELHVACAILATGCFSSEAIYHKYLGTLIRRAGELKTHIVCGGPEQRRRFAQSQFLEPSFEEFKRRFKKRLKELAAETTQPPGSLEKVDFETLLRWLDAHHHNACNLLRKNVQIHETEMDLTVWFWIADRKRAILAFPLPKGSLVAYAIETVDTDLTTPLVKLHGQLAKKATDSPSEPLPRRMPHSAD